MQLLLNSTILILLLVILYQDLKYRSVLWIIFPLLTGIFLYTNYIAIPVNEIMENFLLNVGFLLIQLMSITLYFSLKSKRFIWVPDNYLGWGDIVFLFSLSFLFSPINYILFFIISLIFAVPVFWIIKKYQHEEISVSVPLAGIQAGFLIILFIINSSVKEFSLQSDYWLMFLI